MLVMDEEAQQEFRQKRREVQALGLTEEQYNNLLANGIQWISRLSEVLVRGLIPPVKAYATVATVIGRETAAIDANLKYAYRLLQDYVSDDDDVKEFYRDRMELLKALKKDLYPDQSVKEAPF